MSNMALLLQVGTNKHAAHFQPFVNLQRLNEQDLLCLSNCMSPFWTLDLFSKKTTFHLPALSYPNSSRAIFLPCPIPKAPMPSPCLVLSPKLLCHLPALSYPQSSRAISLHCPIPKAPVPSPFPVLSPKAPALSPCPVLSPKLPCHLLVLSYPQSSRAIFLPCHIPKALVPCATSLPCPIPKAPVPSPFPVLSPKLPCHLHAPSYPQSSMPSPALSYPQSSRVISLPCAIPKALVPPSYPVKLP